MANNRNMAIDTHEAPARLAELRADADALSAQTQENYQSLIGSLANSKADFIEALKQQMKAEEEMIREVYSLYQTVLQSLQEAESDFEKLDENYAKG